MTRRDKFLEKLESALIDFGLKDTSVITEKYKNLIDLKISKNVSIENILSSLDTPEEIAYEEIAKMNRQEKAVDIKNNIKSKFKSTTEKIKNSIKKIKEIKFDKLFKKKAKKIKNKVKKNKKTVSSVTKKIKNLKTVQISKRKKVWLTILEIVLFIVLFYVSTVFMASVFALLDGVKIYGVCALLFSLVASFIFALDQVDKKKRGIPIEHKKTFYIILSLIVLASLSVGFTIYNYFEYNFINDVSEKYSMTYKTFEYRFPKKGKKLNLYFNNWYKPSYIIEYDAELKDRVKVDVKYYEAFYDLNIKNETGSIYLSLSTDTRDLISMYIDNMKEYKIYNEKELSRYIVKIYVNEEDKDRLVIYD